MNYSQNNFLVTTDRQGLRSITGDGGDNYDRNSSMAYRGRGGRRNFRGGRGQNFRNFNPRFTRYPRTGNEDEEGDFAMGGDPHARNQRGRNDNYMRGGFRGHNNNNNTNNRRGGVRSPPNRVRKEDMWHKVMVPFGAMMGQQELYDMITQNIQCSFEPTAYSIDEKRAFFYIKGLDSAEGLRSISRRITKPDGHKLIFHVQPSVPPPESTIDTATIEKMKERMSARYDPSTQLLNLSAFNMDEGLKQDHLFLPLNRASTMSAVTQIIAEYIPELAGLDVSDNKIATVGHMIDLVRAAPNVVSLNLGQNQIRTLDELDKLKGWSNMTELVLDGNDLCNSYSNETAYISAVRKKFPKVIKLDGKDLPPPITFDLETIVTLPAVKGSYFVNDEVQNLVVLFIKEYFSIYDSDRRRDLVPAYHENAQFSFFIAKNQLMERQTGFNSYIDDSRNLKRIGHYEPDKLAKKIKTGALSVVSFLETLPKTTHDLNSFLVDVSLATQTMMAFVVRGVFKESESRAEKAAVRYFSRTFVTVPSGPGMVIINDMMSITNASLIQAKNALKSVSQTSPQNPGPSSQVVVGAGMSSSQVVGGAGMSSSQVVVGGGMSSSQTPEPGLTPAQLQMVETFSAHSGMNVDFSLKCLQENAWDFQKAGQIFTDLSAQGKIPAEAFIKTNS